MKKNFIRFVLVSVLLTFQVAVNGPRTAEANGNSALGTSLNLEIHGDVAAAGVGLRGTGTGTINFSGIPQGSSVYRAYLYWATLGNANTFTSPSLNGTTVQGQLIGTTGDTCWDVQNNFVYRADVTALVGGNGAYTVAGLPGNMAAGNDTQGASLVVAYTASSLPMRTIIFHDGAVALDFTRLNYTDTIDGFTPDNPTTNARITYIVGDGQARWDSGNVNFNGTPIATNIFSGVDGPFWGTHSFDVTALMSGAPVTTTISNNDPVNPNSPDCLLWAATIFSVTSAEPQATNQLSQSYNRSIYGDVTASGVGLRGRGQGNITMSGVRAGSTVVRALLYWATLGNSGRFTSPQLNGTAVNGQVIGTSADTCWGALRNYSYRADVTHLVGGNGTYTITGLPGDLSAGNDSQGASLVVIYNTAYYRTVMINDGAVTLDLNVHSYTDRIGPFTADQPNAQTHITYLVGDGQSNWNSGSVDFEGQRIANNVFTGVDGEHWGTLKFDVTGLISEPDATTTINNNTGGPGSPDCLLWVASVLSVQTELPVYDFTLHLPLMMNQR